MNENKAELIHLGSENNTNQKTDSHTTASMIYSAKIPKIFQQLVLPNFHLNLAPKNERTFCQINAVKGKKC